MSTLKHSIAFVVLILLPFVGFLVGILRLGVNLKNFPKSSTFAVVFHLNLAAVLLLYAAFWLKLDLFTTSKALGWLDMALARLASTSAKWKSA